jgi:pilus assembly protein Flp/PilA
MVARPDLHDDVGLRSTSHLQARWKRKKERKGANLKHFKELIENLIADDTGQDLIEYALVAALIGLGAVYSIGSLKNSLANTFNKVGSQLTNATA